MTDFKRKIVQDRLLCLDVVVGFGLNGGIDARELIKRIETNMKELSNKYLSFTVGRISIDCGCYEECRCSEELCLIGHREEYDIEYNKRLSEEEALDQFKLNREHEEYVRLRKKFEGK